jgi:hypothetical protein
MNDLVSYALQKTFDLVTDHAVERYFKRRKLEAGEELSEALRNARISWEDAVELDETAAMLHRWERAWREGAVRQKLKLLARALAGEIGRGEEGADEFQQFADVILGLSGNEISFLGSLYVAETAAALEHSDAEQAHQDAMHNLRGALIGDRRLFANYDQFESVGYALGRTGLLIPRVLSSGGYSFAMTMRLERLVELTHLEEFADAALRKDVD